MQTRLGIYAGIALLLGLLFLPGLGSLEGGTHPDERLYLGISAEMHARGTWLTPTLDGSPTWQKPPLLYWAERLCYAVLGPTIFAGRLPVALSAMALALLTAGLGRRMFGAKVQKTALLFMATSLGAARFGRLAMMDVPMALGLTVAAWGVWQATEEERPSALLWAGLGTGVACMLKGPVAVVIALLAFGGFLVLRAPKLILSRWTAGAFLLGAIIGAPWFIASLIVHGQSYLQGFFITENLSRFGKGWALSREMLLVGGFLVFALPWTLLAAGNARVSRRDPGWILPVLWIGATLVTFSLPRDKYPHYGIACLPAAILLAVRAPPPAWACRATGILLALVGLGAGLAIRFPFATAARAALVVGSLSLGAGAVFIGRSQLARGAAAVGLGMSMVAGIALPRMSPELLPRHVRESVGARSLWTYNAQPGGYALIMGRPVRRAFTKEAFVEAISSGAAVIITAQEHEKLPPELRGRAAPLAAWPRFSGSQGIEVLLRSWWSAEIEPLLEPMLVVAALETE